MGFLIDLNEKEKINTYHTLLCHVCLDPVTWVVVVLFYVVIDSSSYLNGKQKTFDWIQEDE